MDLEKSYKNKQFRFGYDLYKVNPIKEVELFFKEALEQSIERNNLKIGDQIKLVFLYEDTNICTKFCDIKDDMKETFEFMCNKDNFDCIDPSVNRAKDNEFKISVKWVKR